MKLSPPLLFEVVWTASAIDFVVDARRYHRFERGAGAGRDEWPFDRPFHLVINLAVGGDWGGQAGIDEPAFDGDGQVLEVAWVRVFRDESEPEPRA